MLALVTTTTAQNSPGTGYTGISVSQGRALKAKTPQRLDPLRRFWTANGLHNQEGLTLASLPRF